MGEQKGKEGRIQETSSRELQEFLAKHGQIVIATTTPHKVKRAMDFFRDLGISEERITYCSAPDEPRDWQRPEEVAQEKVNQVAELLPLSSSPSLIIGTDVVIALNGNVSPLGKLHGTVDDVRSQLMETIGPNRLGLGTAEIRTGVAIKSLLTNQGVLCRVYYPITFAPVAHEEIDKYLTKHGKKVQERAGGLDFAGSLAHRITSIHGRENSSPAFPEIFTRFQNTAFGFPVVEIGELIGQLSRRGGKNQWERIYVNR